jgi:hypothetical protein
LFVFYFAILYHSDLTCELKKRRLSIVQGRDGGMVHTQTDHSQPLSLSQPEEEQRPSAPSQAKPPEIDVRQ